ncbi:MAG: hypothetical protein JSS62_02455 [Verrucomicrobia bacterium]|nr:hypothetical protein [Verrucomicrobiota bacterium]MBS0646911.1 hypothetical protein [Verrucomicrobiota bacterium]
MQYKNMLAACCAIFALSAVGFADEAKCSSKTCGGKPVGPTMNGDRPLIVEPKDSCKGTVKCVNQSKYPNGNRTELVVDTQGGEQKVLLPQGTVQPPVQPGDKVEISGRKVNANGEPMMMGEDVKRNGTSSNLNNTVGG